MAVKRVTMMFLWDEEDMKVHGKINNTRIGALLRKLVNESSNMQLGLHVEFIDDGPWPLGFQNTVVLQRSPKEPYPDQQLVPRSME